LKGDHDCFTGMRFIPALPPTNAPPRPTTAVMPKRFADISRNVSCIDAFSPTPADWSLVVGVRFWLLARSATTSHNGNAVYSVTYARDALGRIATRSETIGGVAHTEDLGRAIAELV